MKNFSHTLTHIRDTYSHRHEPEYAMVFADLYWKTLLCLAGAVVILIGVYSGLQFVNIFADLSGSVPQSHLLPAPLDSALLTSTIGDFDARAAQLSTISSLPAIPDPYSP